MIVTIVNYIGAAWWCVAVALFVVSLACGLAQPFVQKRRAIAAARPAVSAILPVKHLDPGFEASQASMFEQSYPDYEILISAAETRSPALEASQRIASAHPGRACRFFHSHATFAVSPKLNNIATPLDEAANDVVMTKDSNISLDPDVLAAFVQNLTPGVGLVVGAPVAEGPTTFAAQIEASLLNAHARLLLAASALGHGFGVGKVMLFRRDDLERAGGVRSLAGNLAEDTALSMSMARLGLRTTFAHRTVRQEIGARRLKDVFDRQVRWSVIRRANVASYPLEPLASPLPAAIAAALAAPLAGWPPAGGFALTLGGWFLAETAFAALKGWEISATAPLAYLGREGLALAAWLRGWTTHQVTWASRRFDARLGPATPEKPSPSENQA